MPGSSSQLPCPPQVCWSVRSLLGRNAASSDPNIHPIFRVFPSQSRLCRFVPSFLAPTTGGPVFPKCHGSFPDLQCGDVPSIRVTSQFPKGVKPHLSSFRISGTYIVPDSGESVWFGLGLLPPVRPPVPLARLLGVLMGDFLI